MPAEEWSPVVLEVCKLRCHVKRRGIDAGEPRAFERGSQGCRMAHRKAGRFVQAMPYWERVQRDVAACLPLEELETLARRARNLLRKGP